MNASNIASAMLARSILQLLATVDGVPGVDVTPFFPVDMAPPAPGYYFAKYQLGSSIVRRYWDGERWYFSNEVVAPPCHFGAMSGDVWQAVFTEWYPADVAPVHPGYYVREYPALECQAEPDYWDGQQWIIDGGTASVSAGVPAFRWRGIEALAVPAYHVA